MNPTLLFIEHLFSTEIVQSPEILKSELKVNPDFASLTQTSSS
jgi:hypothetical protein